MSLPTEPPHTPGETQLGSDEALTSDLDSEPTPADSSSLPVPSGPLRGQHSDSRRDSKRPSFWKRFRMRGRSTTSLEAASVGDMAVRLDAIEQTVEHFDTTLQAQLEALNARLEDVWEAEEQLSHLAEIQGKLDRVLLAQEQQAKSIDALRRTLGWLAVLVVVAAVSIGISAGLLL